MYGYLRESQIEADKSGLDLDTGLHRTGLDTYLRVIFPNIDDWIYDKQIPDLYYNGKLKRIRPDYRSEKLKLVVEFDGLPHYQNPDIILKDIEKEKIYKSNGYRVIRIPYFIQLTNSVVYRMFGVKVDITLFEYNDKINTSLGVNTRATPAYLCPLGIKRMAKEYLKYPECLEYDLKYLEKFDDAITGLSYLKYELNMIKEK